MAKGSFILYTEYIEDFETLSDDDAGKLIKAIFQYVQKGEIFELTGEAKAYFNMYKRQIDRDEKKYKETIEKRRIAGSKGGKQRIENMQANQANATFAKQIQANQADNVNVNVNDNENVNVNDNVDVYVDENVEVSNDDNDGDKLKLIGGIGKDVVMLSDNQVDLLLDNMSLDEFNTYVTRLADFIISKHANVKNHCNTILRWVTEDRMSGGNQKL